MVLGFSAIVTLLISGSQKLESGELHATRLAQLQTMHTVVDEKVYPLKKTGDVIVSDYFDESSDGYQYQGGLYGSPWKVGHTYSLEEIISAEMEGKQAQPLLSFSWPNQNRYINIDRGDQEAVKDFLQIMDKPGGGVADTLILDFRFLRHIDFGSVIRLFNQIAPQEQISFGAIVNKYQKEELMSSGQPFFSPDQTVFLVDPAVPEPVRGLILLLTQRSGYQLAGNPGTLPDTVCLYTEYQIGPESYRVCPDKWIASPDRGSVGNQTKTFLGKSGNQLLTEMDEIWYKERDTQSIKKHIETAIIADIQRSPKN